MSNPIHLAILGAGRWGTHLVRNFLSHPQAKVVAVVDPNLDCLARLAERLDLTGITTATDWTIIHQLPQVDAVAIVTPASTHYGLIRAALEQGYHVLAEKPLTLTVQESLELCHLAQKQQRQLVIDHTYLFHPAVRQGQSTVASGVLGDLRYGYAARTHLGPVRQDVDALWDLAIHDIAIFNHWLGEFPCSAEARGMIWLQPQLKVVEIFPEGLSDLVWAKLTYPSGFQVLIHLCWSNPDKQRRLTVVGSQAALIFDELAETPLVLQRGAFECLVRKPNTPPTYSPIHQNREVIELQPAEPLREVCTHFLNCVATNQPSQISSGWLGTRLVKILTALTTSLNQGGLPIALTYDEVTSA
ncbi:oxidoreductase [Leptolyngbya sp. 'hensonii']|uniref:Gfo/Idh/MocA family protein n=1 Tax=Leptolyngbya sp. 'hensonii' TaxID=1922337 RepID=UPI00094F98D0|nr:Gfo/Idh/MocA family oxidoreductase [Leptolyngbya sp. 'hensonii']OLP17202.1 oxidoreductase [Leptolyngbya sp. 'hensonii']